MIALGRFDVACDCVSHNEVEHGAGCRVRLGETGWSFGLNGLLGVVDLIVPLRIVYSCRAFLAEINFRSKIAGMDAHWARLRRLVSFSSVNWD